MNSLFLKFLKLTESLEPYDLGDIVFSPLRTDGVPKNEPNTEFEQNLLNSFNRWIISWKRLKSSDIEIIKTLMSSKKYGDTFKEPESNVTLYRGLTGLSSKTLMNWLNVTNEKDIPPSGTCEGKWTMHPIQGEVIDSYTTSFKVADEFSKGKYGSPPNGTYSVIIETKVSENNPQTFFDIDFVMSKLRLANDSHFAEYEVISMSPVNISRISWNLVTT